MVLRLIGGEGWILLKSNIVCLKSISPLSLMERIVDLGFVAHSCEGSHVRPIYKFAVTLKPIKRQKIESWAFVQSLTYKITFLA